MTVKNVYHDGKLIPAKDWDFDAKKPKVKEPKPKKETVVEVETDLSFIDELKLQDLND